MITARLATRCLRLAILALLLTGCGFQPRGQAQLPPELAVVSVQSQQAIGAPPAALAGYTVTVAVGAPVAVSGVTLKTVTVTATRGAETVTLQGWRGNF